MGHSGKERPNGSLILFFPCLLATAFTRQCFLYALFLARLQVEGVTLNLLDNIFLLHFALETAQRILEGLTLLNSDFRQLATPPNWSRLDPIVIARFVRQVKWYVQFLCRRNAPLQHIETFFSANKSASEPTAFAAGRKRW